jgi:hypothetical protein
MLDLFNIPTPQTANYQEFYADNSIAGNNPKKIWVKPRGVSIVRILMIGAGGGGGQGASTSGGGGGGSGAVTSWIGPAIFVPDNLNLSIQFGGGSNTSANASVISYKAQSYYTLLSANGGSGGTGTTGTAGAGGTVMTANQFTASGIFTSIAGQDGTPGSVSTSGTNQVASATTFLSGGSGGAGSAAGTGGSVTPNYGYTALPATTAGGTIAGANGYFITQPILVGCGGAGGTTSTTVGTAGGRGGIGCGGGGSGEDANSGGRGGDGAVYIWAW